MSISVDSLLYEIDLRLNALSSNKNQSIQLEDKLISLNNNQTKLIKIKLDGNNVYKLGLDAFRKRYQDLQFLVENYEDHELIPEKTDVYLNKWIALTDDLSPKLMFYLDSYLLADKDECKNRVIYTNADLIKHSDVTLLLQNNNYKPSFEYQETIVDISEDEIHYYTDGTFTLKKAYVSYIRYPKEIDKEGYQKLDGTDSINQDCELEEYLKDELLTLTIEDLAMYTGNQAAVQNAQNSSQKNE